MNELGFSNAIVQVERKYVGEDIYRIVTIGKTASDGKVNIFLRRNDAGSIYKFTIIKDGKTLFQSADTSLTGASYEIKINEETIGELLNQIDDGFEYTQISFNNDTK